MKLMVAGGGTGGHLFPGISLGFAWLERVPQGEVFFVGTTKGLEQKVVPQAGFRLLFIDQTPLKGRSVFNTLKSLLRLPRSLIQAIRLVRKERPDVATGVGGYASGPAILAAWLLGVPTLLFEANAIPGLTNRILGVVAKKIVSPYVTTGAYFSRKKLVISGVPVRPQLIEAAKNHNEKNGAEHEQPKSPTIFIFGGSQGATAINCAAIDASEALLSRGCQIVHQTGTADFLRVQSAYADKKLQVEVRAFIDDMAAVYRRSDLVVCRAGASTLAELAMMGKPSLLVPLPSAADDHQTYNARAYEKAGAALVLPQSELNGARLSREIQSLIADSIRLHTMSEAVKKFADIDAAQKMCDLCTQLAQKNAESWT